MRSFFGSSCTGLAFAALVILPGCQDIKNVVADVRSTVGPEPTSGDIASCDPAYSLSGFFDSRPEILIQKPAKFPQAGELKRVAVVAPEGEKGDLFVDSFEQILTSIKVGGQPYFQVVSRSDLEQVMKEQGLGRSSSIQQGTAAKLGRVLGVDGVYIPKILEHDVRNADYQPSNQPQAKCTKQTASFKAVPKLVDVETGQIVYAKEIGGSKEERHCENGGGFLDGGLSNLKGKIGIGGPSDETSMMNDIIQAAMVDFASDIAPIACQKKMNIMDVSDDLSSEVTADEFAGAVEFMKTGRYDRACPAWQSLEQRGEKSVALFNNLALCAEIDEKLLAARQYCTKADNLLTRPDEDINLCLENIDKRLVEVAALRATGCERLKKADIREVQQLLIDKGYLGAAADGSIGPNTLSAAIDFQTEQGLPIEGNIDSCLLNDLRGL